jgi:hypothetical protein
MKPDSKEPKCYVSGERRERVKETNITEAHSVAFDALTSGEYTNFALFSCFVNGEPTAAIVSIVTEGEEVIMTPMFIAVTPGMKLVNHDGEEA